MPLTDQEPLHTMSPLSGILARSDPHHFCSHLINSSSPVSLCGCISSTCREGQWIFLAMIWSTPLLQRIILSVAALRGYLSIIVILKNICSHLQDSCIMSCKKLTLDFTVLIPNGIPEVDHPPTTRCSYKEFLVYFPKLNHPQVVKICHCRISSTSGGRYSRQLPRRSYRNVVKNDSITEIFDRLPTGTP